ncbi:MAG: hypothetical protein DHS20C15_29430 [Planctomycetota bacterium]|nr:MAG: hypothetical protein DHS20C15_29430 [Planctomycetota bacterium]
MGCSELSGDQGFQLNYLLVNVGDAPGIVREVCHGLFLSEPLAHPTSLPFHGPAPYDDAALLNCELALQSGERKWVPRGAPALKLTQEEAHDVLFRQKAAFAYGYVTYRDSQSVDRATYFLRQIVADGPGRWKLARLAQSRLYDRDYECEE